MLMEFSLYLPLHAPMNNKLTNNFVLDPKNSKISLSL